MHPAVAHRPDLETIEQVFDNRTMRHDVASTRAIVLWCPDWPITAAVRAHGLDPHAPIALRERGRVFACSVAARADGVRRGLRVREAQSRSPGLLVLDRDPALEARSFEPVLTMLESLTPGVQSLRPGTCAIRARGPARYYGGERAAALALMGCLAELGIPTSAGVADGPFTAEQAARGVDPGRVLLVPEGRGAEFLAPLPVGLLVPPPVTDLLVRLGIRTLGGFAALEPVDVRDRFGDDAVRLHAIARGLDGRSVTPRVPPESLEAVVEFEPAVDRIDQAAFAFREAAERFIAALTAAKLVCTALRLEITSDDGGYSERAWLHPRTFASAEIVDRLRWQLQGGSAGSGLSAGIVLVRVAPVSVDAIGNHERGLFGEGPDDRVHHALSRVQSLLGHEAVVTATIGGGRGLAERTVLVPWGDRPLIVRDREEPWPGSLPRPAPPVVFPVPLPITVLDEGGSIVSVDARGALSGSPARLAAASGTMREVTAWAGPWPVDERWWDAVHGRAAQRFQLVDAEGAAWLLVRDEHGWWAEARYE